MRPYMRAANVTWNGISLDDVKEMDFSPEEFKIFALQSGDVLVGEASGSRLEVGKSAIWRGEVSGACFQNTLIRVRSGDAVLPEYLQKHLAHDARRGALADISKGIGIHHIGAAGLARWQIALAPLSEQKRISDKLDTLLSRVDSCRERLERVPGILKRFRQSVLAAATSGELTREWREGRKTELGWQQTVIADVATRVFDGPFGSHLKSKDYVDEGVRVVRLENIAPLRFIEDKRTYIAHEKFEGLRTHTLHAGDVLFSSFVDDEVRVCLLPEGLDGKAINKADCFCIRTHADLCRPSFLALRLACRSTFDALDEAIHGATRPRINLGQLRAIALDLPSLEEQDEIIKRSSELLGLADAVELRLMAIRRYVDCTVPSALTKAFRGELVPQDSNDEPASILLSRLRAAETISAAPPSRRRPATPGKRPKRGATKP